MSTFKPRVKLTCPPNNHQITTPSILRCVPPVAADANPHIFIVTSHLANAQRPSHESLHWHDPSWSPSSSPGQHPPHGLIFTGKYSALFYPRCTITSGDLYRTELRRCFPFTVTQPPPPTAVFGRFQSELPYYWPAGVPFFGVYN